MPYIHFTQEQKDLAARTDLEVFLRSRGEKLLPSGRDKRLSSDHSVTIRGNHWFDHATHEGGNAIGFVQRFYHLGYADAVSLLLCNGQVCERPVPSPQKEFTLPPANGNMRRVFAYLTQHRRIRRAVSLFLPTPLCFTRMRHITTAYSSARMKKEQPDTHTCGVQPVRVNPFARPWRAVTHGTAFTSQAAAKRSMSSSRPSTCCPTLLCIWTTGRRRTMWLAVERPSHRRSRCSVLIHKSGRCISAWTTTRPDTAPLSVWKVISRRRASPPCGWCQCGKIGTRIW